MTLSPFTWSYSIISGGIRLFKWSCIRHIVLTAVIWCLSWGITSTHLPFSTRDPMETYKEGFSLDCISEVCVNVSNDDSQMCLSRRETAVLPYEISHVSACTRWCSPAQEALNLNNIHFKITQKGFWFVLRNLGTSRRNPNISSLDGLSGLNNGAAAIWCHSTADRVSNLPMGGGAAVKIRPAWCYNTWNDLPADLCGNKRHGDEISISLKGMTFTQVNKQTRKHPSGGNNICRIIQYILPSLFNTASSDCPQKNVFTEVWLRH